MLPCMPFAFKKLFSTTVNWDHILKNLLYFAIYVSTLSAAFNYLKWAIALSHSLNLDNKVLGKAGSWLTGNTFQAIVKHLAEARNTENKQSPENL